MARKYTSNAQLPGSVRKLAPAAQSAYRKAFNDVWETYSRDQETVAKGLAAGTRAEEAHAAGMKAAGPAKKPIKPAIKPTSRTGR